MALTTPLSNSLFFSSSRLSQRICISKVNFVNPTTVLRLKYGTGISILNQTEKSTRNAHATSPTMFPLPEMETKLSDSVMEEVENSGRIMLWGRKWNWLDFRTAVLVTVPHVLALFAPFAFNWAALYVFFGLVVITGYGLTFSYHRNLSHRSFKLPKWLEYFFAYWGVLALQKDPIYWVSTHRYHHKFTDTDKDPHSPINGLWFSHMGWLFDSQKFATKVGETKIGQYSNAGDLEKQPYYRFLNRTYYAHIIASAILLYALGGFPFLVWGLGVRTVFMYHSTFLATSGYHSFGKKAWNTNDLSKNNWFFAMLSFGESWHNNHHAFPYSARVGLEWWQIDNTWYLIKFLESVGLATNVKLPTEKDKQRLAFPTRKTGVKLPNDQSKNPKQAFST